jgi:hypothetical protein
MSFSSGLGGKLSRTSCVARILAALIAVLEFDGSDQGTIVAATALTHQLMHNFSLHRQSMKAVAVIPP